MINSQAQAILDSITNELAELEAGTAVELKKLVFTNNPVSASFFVSDDTYEDFPYRAAVALSSITASMISEVVLSIPDAMSGNYAPVSETYNGGIYLYVAEAPAESFIIPTIVCWR